MVIPLKLNPVLSAACGAALGFYCLSPLFRAGFIGLSGLFALLCLPAALLGPLWALSALPFQPSGGEGSPPARTRLRASPLSGGAAPATPPPGGNSPPEPPVDPRRLIRLSVRWIAAFAVGLALGLGAGGAAIQTRFGIPPGAVNAVSGVLREDPRIVSGNRAMAVLSLREASGTTIPGTSGAVKASASGELPVFFPEENAGRLREFGRGSVVFAGGSLRPAARETGAWLFSADSLHVVKPAPALERFRTGLRLDLIRRFDSAGSAGSWGGLALALLLGIRDNLDSGLSARYRDAGCSHVLALSGMHLAVLAGIIALALTKALGKKPAALAGALCIAVYCFIVGPLPSLTRAALMYLLGTLAILGALKRETLSLLGMAFLIQLLISPGAAASPSFILSYTALAGILSAGTALYSLGRGTVPAFLLGPLSASAGAFLATAPVTVLFFGILRPVGILSGLVLVPLTTVFMLFAIAWLVLNLISPVLSTAAAVPLSLLYSLMEKTVSLAGRLPGLAAPGPLPVLVICAALWVCIIWFAYQRQLARNRLSAFA